ncbi:hypothetical protein VTK73DRAFT_10011 [Phialemonium thermophilum]|uniref:Cytochrome b561 domain-containing protein n=1 Tax=Phialemonium thermophilum TaxID=223376 RepID=A0ABR3Y571_9PEZI
MASATGIPQRVPENGLPETEPLLGRPGDAAQKVDSPLVGNLWLGTGWIAQAGIILFLALTWSAVFLNPLLPFFSPHPLLQSLGLFTLTQAILVLQPTWTPENKVVGARVHASLNLLSFLIFTAGVIIIEVNKIKSHGLHFHSAHGYLGVITAALLLVQYLFGFLMWGVPAVFGGLDNAKALWKYHRLSGYVLYLLLLATVLSSTQTDYNRNVLGIKFWSVLVAAALVVAGLYPRISLTKLGLRRSG